ncbi:MAG TPA: DNA-processing protein DprA [Anaerolineales bacterium]|nr:DNA-processing protein DprA [Anaerolineales bacterium]
MSDRRYWIGFNKVKGIGPAKVRALLDHFGDLESAWNASRDALVEAGLDRRALESLEAARQGIDLDRVMAELEQAGINTLCWDDADYPRRLREIDNPPPLLYLRGSLADSDDWAVAIVGTRRTTSYGKEVARELASALASAGVTVVSGLARGIDAIAHVAALESGGRTIAVLGSGLDKLYPPEHAALAEKIATSEARGALISDYPLGTPPEAANFPPRNRIISGLALGVIVVEAGEDSGALITAGFAMEQGREVFAVPGNIFNRSSRGPNRLIQQGAKIVLNAEDVLEELNLKMVARHAEARAQLPLFDGADETERQLFAHLSAEPLHADELSVLTSLPIATVSSALAMMELKGMARQVAGMTYVVARERRAEYKVE